MEYTVQSPPNQVLRIRTRVVAIGPRRWRVSLSAPATNWNAYLEDFTVAMATFAPAG